MVDSVPECTHFGIHIQWHRKLATNTRKHRTTNNPVTLEHSAVGTGKQLCSCPWMTSAAVCAFFFFFSPFAVCSSSLNSSHLKVPVFARFFFPLSFFALATILPVGYLNNCALLSACYDLQYLFLKRLSSLPDCHSFCLPFFFFFLISEICCRAFSDCFFFHLRFFVVICKHDSASHVTHRTCCTQVLPRR